VETARRWETKYVTTGQLMELQVVLPTAGPSLPAGCASVETPPPPTLVVNAPLGGTKTMLPPPLSASPGEEVASKQVLRNAMTVILLMETDVPTTALLLKLPGSALEDRQQQQIPAPFAPLDGIKMMLQTLTPE
jgi:hypothetical protein